MNPPHEIKPSIYLKHACASVVAVALGLGTGACGRSEVKRTAFIAPPQGFIVGENYHSRKSIRTRLGRNLTIVAWLGAEASPTRDYLKLLARSARESGLSVLTRDPSVEADSKISIADVEYAQLFEPYTPTLSILGPNGEVTFSSSSLPSPDEIRQLVEKSLYHTINYENRESAPIEALLPGQRIPRARGTRVLSNGMIGPEAELPLADAKVVYLSPRLKSCQVKSALEAIAKRYNATDHAETGRVVVLVSPLHDSEALRDFATELPETYLVTDSAALFDPNETRYRPTRAAEVGLIGTAADGVIHSTAVFSGEELEHLFGGPFHD